MEGRWKAIFPWSLSIADFLLISRAFTGVRGSVPVVLLRISDEGRQVDGVDIGDSWVIPPAG